MTKKRIALWVMAFVVLFGIAWHFLLSATTPKGQPALTYLTMQNPGQFADLFNHAVNRARIVLLLSPT